MANYAYKVKGRKLELLQQDIYNYWVTPLVTSVGGLKIEYTERAMFLEPTAQIEWDTESSSILFKRTYGRR